MNRSDLHNYQTRAIDFVTSKQRCGLFLDLGLGKTVITLTAINDMLNASIIKRVLIVGPLRVVRSVWPTEPKRWSHLEHLNVVVATGTAQQRKDAINSGADITAINRENVTWLVELCAKKKKWPFDCIIVDESSSFKAVSSKRWKRLRKVTPLATVVVLLTGTPAPQSLMDLFAQMYLIDSGESLGRTITGYRQRFFNPDYFGYSWEIKPGSAEKIQELIKPLILSMQGSDYINLPERIDIIERIVLPVKVQKQYDDFSKELFLEFDGVELEAMSAAILANKLLQMTSGACYVDDEKNWKTIHTCKLDALEELIEENPGESILVSYNYKHTLVRLRERFPQMVVLGKDPDTIDKWNRKEIRLMAIHPQSGAFGLNLQQGGCILIWVDLVWSLELKKQLDCRLYRQGQDKPVRIIHLVVENSIDNRVMDVLQNKNAVQADLLKALR